MTIATDAITKPFERSLPKLGKIPGQPWYLQTSFLTQHRNRITTAIQYERRSSATARNSKSAVHVYLGWLTDD